MRPPSTILYIGMAQPCDPRHGLACRAEPDREWLDPRRRAGRPPRGALRPRALPHAVGGRETRVPPRIDLHSRGPVGGPAGADGVALTGQIRATGISRIWALPKGSAVSSIFIAELEVDRLIQHVDLRSLGDTAVGARTETGHGPSVPSCCGQQWRGELLDGCAGPCGPCHGRGGRPTCYPS